MSESTVSEPIAHHWYTRPVLFVSDVQGAIGFYVEKLGFRKKWHTADGKGTVCQGSFLLTRRMTVSARPDDRLHTTLEHFRIHGWMRVPAAFNAAEASAMRDAVWRAIEGVGIHGDRPSSWTTERPIHLQHLKTDPVFQAVRSTRRRAAIDVVLEGRPYDEPKSAGACFLAFPSACTWGVPSSGWHIDANYSSALIPPAGVQTHALFGDVGPRGGSTQLLSGSHRLVHKWFKDHPPPKNTRGGELRLLLREHPYIRDLHTEGDAEARIARFMDRVETMDGIPLQVVENTGAAGDVILLHPLVLHVAAPNASTEPRFLLSGGVDTPAMYAGSNWLGIQADA